MGAGAGAIAAASSDDAIKSKIDALLFETDRDRAVEQSVKMKYRKIKETQFSSSLKIASPNSSGEAEFEKKRTPFSRSYQNVKLSKSFISKLAGEMLKDVVQGNDLVDGENEGDLTLINTDDLTNLQNHMRSFRIHKNNNSFMKLNNKRDNILPIPELSREFSGEKSTDEKSVDSNVRETHHINDSLAKPVLGREISDDFGQFEDIDDGDSTKTSTKGGSVASMSIYSVGDLQSHTSILDNLQNQLPKNNFYSTKSESKDASSSSGVSFSENNSDSSKLSLSKPSIIRGRPQLTVMVPVDGFGTSPSDKRSSSTKSELLTAVDSSPSNHAIGFEGGPIQIPRFNSAYFTHSQSSHFDLNGLNGIFHIGKWQLRSDTGLSNADSVNGQGTNLINICDQFVEVGALGNGASGMVVEALHIPTLTIVALKMLPVHSSEKRLHFKSELEVLYKNLTDLKLVKTQLEEESMLEDTQNENRNGSPCPYIVSFYNAFVNPRSGMINLVIEYVDGGSLEDLVQRGGCQDEVTIADIAYQTLKGLRFIHRHNFIHRDIKPSNILTSTSGRVKIADFGISKVFDKELGFANSFVGTVCYMSPERIQGKEYDAMADIWSFGLTMLAVSEGHFPLHQGAKKKSEKNPFSYSDPKTNDMNDNTESKLDGLTTDDREEGKGDLKEFGGYWGMIKAICDDEPPTPGDNFSIGYCDFISRSLRHESKDRSSADELLKDAFIKNNKERFIANNGSSGTSATPFNWDSKSARPSFDNGPKTPLSKEITSGVARRGSRDKVPPFDVSTGPGGSANDGETPKTPLQNQNFPSDSSPDRPQEGLPGSSHLASPPHQSASRRGSRDINNIGESGITTGRSDYDDVTEEERDIERVRYEHLDRMLRKLFKHEKQRRQLDRIPSETFDDEDDGVVVPYAGEKIELKYDPSEGKYDEYKSHLEDKTSTDLTTSLSPRSGGGRSTSGSVALEASLSSKAPSTSIVDMLPSLSELEKWDRLCDQLHLPFEAVKAYIEYFRKKNKV